MACALLVANAGDALQFILGLFPALCRQLHLAIAGILFAAPIVASVIAYNVVEPTSTANYGELLLPPVTVTPHRFDKPEGGALAPGAARARPLDQVEVLRHYHTCSPRRRVGHRFMDAHA